ncbi:Uu.00g139210.m01.CDS01 [Anthostomella pinea]|uniref:Uu.00g139210.m01.CDS01 n=1 Tax=Anthostomella pinea TaxID=933095 RepID=A0AAI8VPX5_9PEZI|nr:Uu.00g139210.m01.CDS01 [Anthostomella pinea]
MPLIDRQIGNGLSAYSVPADLSITSRALFHKVYSFFTGPMFPHQLRDAVRSVGSARIWVGFLFQDEAFFHCAIAMAAAAFDPSWLTQQETAQAMVHLSRGMRIVNERLSGDDALSDLTLGVVLSMSQHESLRNRHHQGLVHLNGLLRMIELRGGISVLAAHNPAIAQKVFRADVQLALQLGTPTRYSVNIVPGAFTIDWLRMRFQKDRNSSLGRPDISTHVSAALSEMLEGVMSLAWLVNNSPTHGITLDGYDFHDVLVLFGYRLVHMRPLGEPHTSTDWENVLHLALVAFMSEFFFSLGLRRPEIPILSRELRAAIQVHCYDDKLSEEILLWVLFIGKASLFRNPGDDVWLVPKIAATASQLNLHTWQDVSRTLYRMPWVHAFQDEPSQALWEQSRSYSSAHSSVFSEIQNENGFMMLS